MVHDLSTWGFADHEAVKSQWEAPLRLIRGIASASMQEPRKLTGSLAVLSINEGVPATCTVVDGHDSDSAFNGERSDLTTGHSLLSTLA